MPKSQGFFSIILLLFKGLNFGVDFKGGTLIELRVKDKTVTITNIRDSLNQINLGDISVKKFQKIQQIKIERERVDTSQGHEDRRHRELVIAVDQNSLQANTTGESRDRPRRSAGGKRRRGG